MKKFILGIDPGKSGGIAMVSDDHQAASSMAKMTDVDKIDLIKKYISHIDVCYLEKVHSMPGQGVKSTFTFGQGYGFIVGVILTLGIRLEHVSPNKWQTYLSCRSRGNKNVTKAKAQELFPMVDKITHATADALLIAEYGRRKESGL